MKNKTQTPEDKFLADFVKLLNKHYKGMVKELIRDQEKRRKELKKFCTSQVAV